MMTVDRIKSMAVVGAGTMGSGIAQVAAQHGFQAILFDLNPEMLKKAAAGIQKNLQSAIAKNLLTDAEAQNIVSRISYTDRLESIQAEMVIEAIIEKLEPKQELFCRLADQLGSEAILATNTSSIPITRIARPVPHPERVVGMHFFNPAHIMKLVEVISGASTAPEVAQLTAQLALKMKKVPVMAADAPGFIVNRVARHYYVESLKILEEGVCGHEQIDEIMESLGFKMGPFRLMDLIGVDTNFSVTSSLYESFHQDGKFRPSRIQQQKVEAGFHGRKSGKGFYDYPADKK